MKPGLEIPLNAVIITLVITCLLSLINIGSTVAFNAIASLALVGILGTYIISITCLVLRRLRKNDPLPPHRWSLGRFGIFVNIGALIYLYGTWVFLFFPISIPVTAATMNWSSLMFGSAMIVALIYYAIIGRKTYTAPVTLVKRT